MKHTGLLSVAALSLGLAGCGELPFQAALVTQTGASAPVSYTGTLYGNINGSSRYTLTSADGSDTCTGATTPEGAGDFVCTGGQSGRFTFPRELVGRIAASTTGVTDNGIRYAFGWGGDADPARLVERLP